MVGESAPQRRYVLEAQSLIQLERHNRLRDVHWEEGLRDGWIIIPRLVANEVTQRRRAPLAKLLSRLRASRRRGWTGFVVEEERESCYQLLLRGLHGPEAAALAIAHHRRATIVPEERVVRREAGRLNVRCLSWSEFLQEIRPQLL